MPGQHRTFTPKFKLQMVKFFENGKSRADIPTSAKKSSHKSHQTIMEHYIKLNSNDVDTYL